MLLMELFLLLLSFVRVLYQCRGGAFIAPLDADMGVSDDLKINAL